jgi:ketosteroid isomerase-like protein
MDGISVEQVHAAVHGYWDALARKAKERLTASYAADAIVFVADSRRTEPARLVIERRNREFFNPKGSLGAEVGSIDVQIPEPDVAIAIYSYRFYAISMKQDKLLRVDLPVALATQIFRRDPDGQLRIIHEHLSSACDPIMSILDV